jgi:hypothetical protein
MPSRYPNSEEFRLTVNQFYVRTISETKHALSGALMKTGPVRDAQQMKQCVYNIPPDCGRCYIGETGRLLEACIRRRPQICWKEAKGFQIQANNYRKYKELAHISLVAIRVFPVWTPTIEADVRKLKFDPVKVTWE